VGSEMCIRDRVKDRGTCRGCYIGRIVRRTVVDHEHVVGFLKAQHFGHGCTYAIRLVPRRHNDQDPVIFQIAHIIPTISTQWWRTTRRHIGPE